MLWLATACGLALLEARRRAYKAKATSPAALRRVLGPPLYDTFPRADVESLPLCVGDFTLKQLKQELSNFPESSSNNCEHLSSLLRDGENSLRDLCKLLQVSTNAEVIADVTELLALLSPSRRGLQIAIVEAGTMPPLLRLLTLANTPLAANVHEKDSLDAFHSSDTWGPKPCRAPPDQEKGLRSRKTSVSGTLRSEDCSISSRTGSSRSIRSSSNIHGGGTGTHCSIGALSVISTHTRATTAAAASGIESMRASVVPDPVILSNVLRTLVNLTSNSRAGAPVRQAILRDASAVDALLGLLHVPEEDKSTDWRDSGSDADGPGELAEEELEALQQLTGGCKKLPLLSGTSGMETLPAAWVMSGSVRPSATLRWHIAGLAAWLVAHLCSVPAGQLQLVQEGVVPALVWLIRQGRMAWAAERAAVGRRQARGDVPASASDGEELRLAAAMPGDKDRGGVAGYEGGEQRAAPAAGRGQVQYTSGRLMPHVSSTLVYDAAAAEVNGSPRAAAMPHIIAAVQYGLMALVNITFDNSANQRSVAMSGVLVELEALFAALLQPGVLLPQTAPAVAAAHGKGHSQGPGLEEEGQEQQQGSGDLAADGGDDDDGGYNSELELLLRRGHLGLAKFAVWLVAHLSSSDPDLKADIAGPLFNFLPRLLELLILPDVEKLQHHHQQQHGAHTTDTVAAATSGVLIVRQYAAMALVNLTCGVPSTKAAVARAMDWDGMAALLQWLAEETERAVAAETAEAAAGETALRGQTPPLVVGTTSCVSGGPPVSDLLLYTVWLMQHMSLSPIAAAVADPRVIPPLVAHLNSADAHVRLRASAAIGALCSSTPLTPSPPPPTDKSVSAAASDGCCLAGVQHPHRAAFLTAGGVQRLLAVARRERDPHLLAYGMLCLSSGVGDDLTAVAEAVGGGALALLEALLASEHPACLVPAAEALQALAQGARGGLRRHNSRVPNSVAAGHLRQDQIQDREGGALADEAAAVAAVSAAADYVPRSLLARIVSVMLTHRDPAVRNAMNDALGTLTSLPGVRERYCAVFAETLRDLVSAAEVELQVIPVN